MAKKKQRPKLVDNEQSLTDPRGPSIMRQFYKPPRKPAPVKITRPPRPSRTGGDEVN
jgi:hypothetical protein